MVFFFGRQIQTSAYLRSSLVSAVRLQELQNLMRELEDRRSRGPLDPTKPPPKGFEAEAEYVWRSDFRAEGPSAPQSWNATPEQIEQARRDREEAEAREKARRAPFETWIKEELERYGNLCEAAERQASQSAEDRVPKSMDISLLGGGWSFLLEFSTVIVILFILLCMGILNSINGKDAVTILASIAGYVLGKASAAVQTRHAQSPAQTGLSDLR
jgi:hypothetical protein